MEGPQGLLFFRHIYTAYNEKLNTTKGTTMRKLVNLEGTPVSATAVTIEIVKTLGITAVWGLTSYVVITFAKGFVEGYITRAQELKEEANN